MFGSETAITPGKEVSKDCSWDARIAQSVEKGKTHVGKMDAIPRDSHLDAISRINMCMMMNVTVLQLEYARVLEGTAKFVRKTVESSTV